MRLHKSGILRTTIAVGMACAFITNFAQVAAEAGKDDPYAGTSKTKVGDMAPAFELTSVDGVVIRSGDWKGKVGLVTFFATWCGPCRAELPILEKEIWEKYKGESFAMVVVGREHTNAELASFKEETKFTFPLAGDPERAVYSKYATQYIPRNYVIGPDGKILFQSIGYDEAEFEAMKKVITEALAGLKQASAKPGNEPAGASEVASAPHEPNAIGLQHIEAGGEIRIRANFHHQD